ncbi:Sir2 family NAD-dependent protein deacetylase [Paenibacillus sp. FSL K6-2862]|uniref:Sir2 family NAD-dependent protein deacetylase n=1 Tax=Paenibacillus sp. FSL K6-2862 TaxID=2921484 RepID=UPI0030F64E96
MNEKYQKIINKIQDAKGIIIGASNGLSISEGVHIFANNKDFQTNFGDLSVKYGFHSIIEGCFYPFPSEPEKWAFFSRLYNYFLYNKQVSSVMKNLYELIKVKNYFVITSNIDDHFRQAGFAKERLFEIEGNCSNLQCSNSCHDQIYPGDEILSKMNQHQEDGKVPLDLIPCCPVCSGPMQVHVEVDRNFLRGQSWQESYQGYQNFIDNVQGDELVLLELGVGARNKLIKAPLMNLTILHEKATYITFNKGTELFIPDTISSKSIGIDGDISDILQQLVLMK